MGAENRFSLSEETVTVVKNIAWVNEPPRGARRQYWTGWVVRTQWRGKIVRKRFRADTKDDTAILARAMAWLRSKNKQLGKPTSKKWLRSSGVWGRGKSRGRWTRV